MTRARIGVFGGTFDPVHVGHLAIALAALEEVPLDRVLFVLARRSPLKADGPEASEDDRLRMLEAAIADEPRFAISRLELERPGPSYTVDTLESLRDQGDLFLILGADAADELDKWRDPERVRELATLVVAPRPGWSPPSRADRTIALRSPLLDVSSRQLRAMARSGRSLRYLVPDPVRRHIEARGLYRPPQIR